MKRQITRHPAARETHQPVGKTTPRGIPPEIDRWINEGGALGRGKSLDTPIGDRIDANCNAGKVKPPEHSE
ncbi:MAG: hypothetical protein WD851_10900 [Pirellulales bacterium]